ncbi:MAG: 3-phosphoglycerate dehydrogenase family protein [Oscillospiraceae bacterium]|nr:3-phosphoglycerate dehydrogenase family protein [Oscillospiraceae bacterium]
MFNIKLLNKIAKVGTDVFGDKYKLGENIDNPDGIIVRSADMLEMEFGANLKAIARAGAGYNNIPVDKCTEQGIVVFTSPGANANGVKELAVASLILASRDIIGGIEWVKTLEGEKDIAKLVEKGKSAYVGNELEGKTLGVIGLGATGGLVASIATHLGMNVIGCDPYLSVEAAWKLSRAVKKAANYDEIFAKSDYITIHALVTDETRGMLNNAAFAKMKQGVKIINLARADLVNSADMKAALESGKVSVYVTDFPTDETVGVNGIINIPHLGASTLESEDNSAVMAAEQLKEFLENGNIKNSVNFPDTFMPHYGDARICVLHRNIPNVLAEISAAVSAEKINIENMLNRSKKDYAYTIVEIIGEIPQIIVDKLNKLESIIRVFIIK